MPVETGTKKGGRLAIGGAKNLVFSLLFSLIQRTIYAANELLQRLKMPFAQPCAERYVQVFFTPDAILNGGTPRFQ